MTLVEVLGSLTILAMVLGSMLITRARLTHQTGVSQQRAVAVEAADALLRQWWQDGKEIPVDAQGALPEPYARQLADRIAGSTSPPSSSPSSSSFSTPLGASSGDSAGWRTREVDREGARDLLARVVQLEIGYTHAGEWQTLIAVELLVPEPTDEPTRHADQ